MKQNKQILPMILTGGMLLIILFIVVYTGMQQQKLNPLNAVATSQPAIELSPSVTQEEPTVSESAKVTFKIDSDSYYFKPAEIKVKQGDTVVITLNNLAGVHDFVLDEFNVQSKTIKDAGTDTFEFVADKTGSFEFYCSIGQHRQMGMKGTLVVE